MENCTQKPSGIVEILEISVLGGTSSLTMKPKPLVQSGSVDELGHKFLVLHMKQSMEIDELSCTWVDDYRRLLCFLDCTAEATYDQPAPYLRANLVPKKLSERVSVKRVCIVSARYDVHVGDSSCCELKRNFDC